MKKIKLVILAIMLVLGFALQSEIFHIECWNFNTGYYLSSTISYSDEAERTELISDLYRISKENDVTVFAVNITTVNQIEYEMVVFADADAHDYIYSNHNISKQKYYSVLSGNINVEYCDFLDLAEDDNKYVNTISFIGDKADVINVYKQLKDRYHITYPRLMGANEKDMIYLMWGIIALLMVIMTCIEVLYNKKEVVLRVSLGQDVKEIIINSIVIEILTDMIMFFVIKTMVFQFISGEFMKNTVIGLFILGIAVSCLCYLFYGVYDTKKVFANVNDSKEILMILYILKALVTMASIGVIVTNLGTVMNDILVSNESGIVAVCQEYSYISIKDEALNTYYDEAGERIKNGLEYEKAIFKEYYEKAKPLICNVALVDPQTNTNYVCVNEFGGDLLTQFTDGEELENADIVCFIPRHINNENALQYVESCIGNLIMDADNLNIKEIIYCDYKYLTCIDTNAAYGMKTVINPVVIYSRYDGLKNINNIAETYFNNVLFNLSDEDVIEIEEKYKLRENGYKIVKTSVAENYEYHKNVIRRSIAFFSSICSFTVILQVILVFAINKMEYQMNAMEMALKKVLGYSIWRKNTRALLSSIVFHVLITILLCILGEYTQLFSILLCIFAGTFMLVIEILAIVFNVFYIEKQKISKILKGGCL